ncbi:MAG: restriction endonuclease subunit S [Akkermansia muciniphila]
MERKLGESCTLQGGNAWKSVDYCDGGTHLVVTIANVSGEAEVNDSVGKYIDAPLNSEYILQKGDILISLTGNVGRVSRMSSKPAVLNQRVARVFLKEGELQNDFVFAILRNPQFERSMIDSGQGAAQKNIRGLPISLRKTT